MNTISSEAEARGKSRAIILLAHGSRQPAAVAGLAASVAALAARVDVAVVGAFLEAGSPTLPEAATELLAAGVQELTVQPLLLYDGRHSLEDIPALIEDLRRCYPDARISCGRPLGYSPLLSEVLLERLADAGFTV